MESINLAGGQKAQRDYDGSYISGSLGGVKVGNPSLKKYYKGML